MNVVDNYFNLIAGILLVYGSIFLRATYGSDDQNEANIISAGSDIKTIFSHELMPLWGTAYRV
jgi:hypothetical protein